MLHLKLACTLGAATLIASGATFHAAQDDCPLGLGDFMRKLHGGATVSAQSPVAAAVATPSEAAPVSFHSAKFECPLGLGDFMRRIHGIHSAAPKSAAPAGSDGATVDCPLGEIMKHIHAAHVAAKKSATATTTTPN